MDYAEARQYIDRGLSHLSDGNFEEFQHKFAMMEAYLPIPETERQETINRLASRLASYSRFIDAEDYTITSSVEEFIASFTAATGFLTDSMVSADASIEAAREQLEDVPTHVEITGEVERVPEDSAWGSIVSSILEEET